MRLHKPVGIYLLLWPTLTALWIAGNGHPDWKLIIIFSLGVILTRSAGCVINDYADRDFDKHVARTQDRPLANGTISKQKALLLFLALLIAAFILVLQTNLLTITLSVGAALLMALYPFMKRFIHAPQLVLGLAFSWAVPMAFAAQTGAVPVASLWLMGYVICWAIAYDTMYAMGDKIDDLKIGVKSTAILFAPYESLWIALFQLVMLACLFMAAQSFALTWPFYVGLIAASLLMLYHHWYSRTKDTRRFFSVFLQNHWIGFILFVALLIAFSI